MNGHWWVGIPISMRQFNGGLFNHSGHLSRVVRAGSYGVPAFALLRSNTLSPQASRPPFYCSRTSPHHSGLSVGTPGGECEGGRREGTLGETTLRDEAKKEGLRAPLRTGDGVSQGWVGRSCPGLRRGEGSLPLQRQPLRLLARARRLSALEEEGHDEGAMRIPRPTVSGSSGALAVFVHARRAPIRPWR